MRESRQEEAAMAILMIVAPGSPESASQSVLCLPRQPGRAARTPLAFLRLLRLFYEVSVQGQANEKKRANAGSTFDRTVWRFGVHN